MEDNCTQEEKNLIYFVISVNSCKHYKREFHFEWPKQKFTVQSLIPGLDVPQPYDWLIEPILEDEKEETDIKPLFE